MFCFCNIQIMQWLSISMILLLDKHDNIWISDQEISVLINTEISVIIDLPKMLSRKIPFHFFFLIYYLNPFAPFPPDFQIEEPQDRSLIPIQQEVFDEDEIFESALPCKAGNCYKIPMIPSTFFHKKLYKLKTSTMRIKEGKV